MNTIKTLVAVIAIGALAAIGFAYSGFYDVSASSPDSGPIGWLLSTTSHASVERRAKAIDVPDLDDDSLVLAGVNDFNSMCAGCHGAPGQQPEAMGQGLNPPPPDLVESAAQMTPAELFWVTKNGIKMTGMPAWGATHEDAELWPVVAIMTTLPDLDAESYQALLARAEGIGHHAGDAADDGHSHAAEANDIDDHDAHDDAAVVPTGHDHSSQGHGVHDHADSAATEAGPESEQHDEHGDHAH